MTKKSPKRTTRKPIAAGIFAGMFAAAAAIWAITTYWPREAPDPMESTTVQPAPAAPDAPVGFSILEGPQPGQDTPYDGVLVAWTRWSDDAGEHVAILSKESETLEALHYGRTAAGFELLAGHSARPDPAAPEATAAFFRDGVRAGDADGDGLGEAMFAYYFDEDPGPGPKPLALIAFTGDRTLSMSGTTRYDPADAAPAAPVTRLDDAMQAAPEAIRDAASRLWAEAQFDLAEPPAYADFFPHRRFAGATFSGDDPSWSLTVLPQYVLLKLASEEKAAVINYESIRANGRGLIIEGKGEIEAWSHGFRVTVIEEPITAPHGQEYPFSATVDWSDGTRLSGWGNLAVDSTIGLAEQDAP